MFKSNLLLEHKCLFLDVSHFRLESNILLRDS